MKMVPINEGKKLIRGMTEVNPEVKSVEVGIYPHRMLEWEYLNELSTSNFNTAYYTIAMGLTRSHPQLKSTCYLTIRQTYIIKINNKDSFRAVGESVYKIYFGACSINEDVLLELAKDAYDWFINEFISRKQNTRIQFTQEPAFPLQETILIIRESMDLAGYK